MSLEVSGSEGTSRRLSALARAVAASPGLPPGSRALAAVSGGADSVALMLALAELFRAGRLDLRIAHVHHGLRDDEADRDAERVSRLADGLGLACEVVRVDTPAARSRRRRGLEEAARALRREALEQVARRRGCDRIALAHTRDDQAETLLLRLLRGSGPAGLGGMAAVDLPWVRPLLRLRRRQLRETLLRLGVTWGSDPSNWGSGSARALLRPIIERAGELFNEELVEQLASAADCLAEDDAELESLAEEAAAELIAGSSEPRGPASELRLAGGAEGVGRLRPALARRVARRFLIGLAPDRPPPSRDAVERVLRLASIEAGAARSAHVRGLLLRRQGSEVVVGGAPRPASDDGPQPECRSPAATAAPEGSG